MTGPGRVQREQQMAILLPDGLLAQLARDLAERRAAVMQQLDMLCGHLQQHGLGQQGLLQRALQKLAPARQHQHQHPHQRRTSGRWRTPCSRAGGQRWSTWRVCCTLWRLQAASWGPELQFSDG